MILEKLKSELASLRSRKPMLGYYGEGLELDVEEVASVIREMERLKEALEVIAEGRHITLELCRQMARAALKDA